MIKKQGRYSSYLRPMAYLIDLVIILLFALQFDFGVIDFFNFAVYISIGWLFLSFNSNFYEIYRYTKVIRIISLSFLQIVLFALIVFAFFGIFNDLSRPPSRILVYVGRVFLAVLFSKLAVFYLLRRYRKSLGGNFRKTIIIGSNRKTRQLRDFFVQNPTYGYQCKKMFTVKSQRSTPKDGKDRQIGEVKKPGFTLGACFDYILKENIDEIYCSIAELKNEQIKTLVDFADNNLKVLKFIPDNKEIYAKELKLDYYGLLPVLSMRNIPIEDPLNQLIKRGFDIVLSIFVITCFLSWLTPILAIFIKLESKGPVFFRQLRNGLDYKEFYCYKFRSMKLNPEANIHQVRKNDKRITPVGRFMRKTSIDELPQFFNVLMGNMSVVGPRPHMVSHTHMYAERVDKFMVRHFIKPGITGLAQTSGYRGEVENENDIINRVKYDIFYVENWSLLLDIKITFQTIHNAIKGDKKAY